ncbi:AI-2E family transporter [Burkholderia sp. FERM BP-3421]|uniref:AI-2E family transporter n=1 Tax=Burkholderia sp. FERM BP-3421 TaxID=1494466 RepID=UPI0023620E4C|nr:AI-2E family transporter [Burkholderia sp. FERM BP-3421]WDD91811.1 AI-2E family transporter [Burkholderia sp. FERM BP-3421]
MASTPSSSPNPSSRPKAQAIALGVLYMLLVALALWVISDFLPAIVWACVIAIALWPALHRIDAWPPLRGRTTLVAVGLTAAVALLLVVPVVIGLAQAAGQAHALFEWGRSAQQNGIPVPDALQHLPFGAQQATTWWQENLAKPLHAASAVKGVNGENFLAFSRHFGSRIAHAGVLFGFMLITLFVIFQAGPRLSDALLKGVQRAFGADGAALIQRMVAAVHGTVTGLVVVGLGEGALLGVAYALAGVPHAALLGLVTAVAAMLPFCAPLVFCGAALWLFAQGMAGWAIGLAAFGFVVVFVAEHFVRPVLIGSSARLPFLLVLFGILGGAETFGLLGLFIGPALMTVLTVLWAEWVC